MNFQEAFETTTPSTTRLTLYDLFMFHLKNNNIFGYRGEIIDIVDKDVTTNNIENIGNKENQVNDFRPLNIVEIENMDTDVVNYLEEFGIIDKRNLPREKKSTNNGSEELLIKIIKNLEELKTLNISINDTNIQKNEHTTENTLTTLISKRETIDIKEKQVSDLEDSFGVGDINKSNQSELPGKKKNGFYLLADWNSFLEVGDGDEKVVVRLNKTVGDPSLFIPVKIP